jgi:hypothetical protein
MSLLILFFAFLDETTARSTGSEAVFSERLRTEAPLVWREYRDVLLHSTGVARRSERVGQKLKRETEVAFWTHGDSQKYVMKNSASGAESVLCRSVSSGYVFSLRRASRSEDFVVSRIDAYGLEADDDKKSEQLLLQVGLEFLLSPCSVEGKFLPDLVDSPGFALRSAQPGDGNQFVLLFDFVSSDPNQMSIQNGRIVLSPDEKWSVLEYELPLGSGNIYSKVEYDGKSIGEDGFRVPSKVLYQEWGGPVGRSELGTNVEFVFTECNPHVGSDSEFTLTSFGLSEAKPPSVVVAVQQQHGDGLGGSYWIWFIGLSVLFAVLAVIIRRKSERVR